MLRGRGTEQAEIEALLGSARAGVSGALVLRGEPGIGKTALLREAVADAAGMRVLRSAGIESEAELPFAGLHQLLRGELHRLGALPAPQRRALSGAFGLGDAVGDRFMVGAGVLSLLAEVAEESPVLCVVDDAHWLDRASAEALLFAARRLDREGVAVLLAVRDYAEALTGSGLPELHLSGLDDESAAALLDERLPAELRARLLTETRGNPLALRELPSVVAGHGPGPLPLTARVLDAFHHRIRSLPGATRTLLLLAAADDSGEPAAILRAGERLGVGVAELGPAEEQRLVTNELAFRHPLIRAAVYHGAPLVQRIAAHEALAAAYAARGDEDREAWHRAVAAPGADEQVADKLARTARRAEERHAYAAAASAYERAAQLSETSVAAALRLTSACEAAIHNGRFDWARSRAERVLPDVGDGPTRARLAEVRAAADFAQGSLSSAHKLLLEHAPLTPEPERAFWMVLRALHAGWAAPDGAPLLAAALDGFDALALAPDHPLRSVAWLARWGAAPGLGWDTAGYPDLDDVLDRARVAAREAGPRGLMEVASRSFVVGRDDVSCEVSAELVGTARDTGMPFALAPGLGHLTLTQVLLGRHRDALISGDEGLRIARDTGQPLWTSYVHGALAYLAAVEGDESRSREHAEAAGAGQVGSAWAQTALALLDLGHGRLRDAFDRLRDLMRRPPQAPGRGAAFDPGPRRGRRPAGARGRGVGRGVRELGRGAAGAVARRAGRPLPGAAGAGERGGAALPAGAGTGGPPVRPGADGAAVRRVAAPGPPQDGGALAVEVGAAHVRGARFGAVGGAGTHGAGRRRGGGGAGGAAGRVRGADPAGAADHPVRGAGPVEPGHRGAAVPEPADGRLPPVQGVSQARCHLAGGAGRAGSIGV